MKTRITGMLLGLTAVLGTSMLLTTPVQAQSLREQVRQDEWRLNQDLRTGDAALIAHDQRVLNRDRLLLEHMHGYYNEQNDPYTVYNPYSVNRRRTYRQYYTQPTYYNNNNNNGGYYDRYGNFHRY